MAEHEKHGDIFACLLVYFNEVKRRLFSEVVPKEEADEGFDFAVQSVRMETAHYAESDYV